MNADLDPPTRRALLQHARAAVRAAAAGSPPPRAGGELTGRGDLATHAGCFVTLKTRAGALRGCIGTFHPDGTLTEVIGQMACQAAIRDPRFPAVQPDEVDDLRVSLSILTPRQRSSAPSAIEVGRHGVEVQRGGARGVFLPQVAPEQGWGRERLLDEVCRKAHLPADAWRAPETELYTFEAIVFDEEDA